MLREPGHAAKASVSPVQVPRGPDPQRVPAARAPDPQRVSAETASRAPARVPLVLADLRDATSPRAGGRPRRSSPGQRRAAPAAASRARRTRGRAAPRARSAGARGVRAQGRPRFCARAPPRTTPRRGRKHAQLPSAVAVSRCSMLPDTPWTLREDAERGQLHGRPGDHGVAHRRAPDSPIRPLGGRASPRKVTGSHRWPTGGPRESNGRPTAGQPGRERPNDSVPMRPAAPGSPCPPWTQPRFGPPDAAPQTAIGFLNPRPRVPLFISRHGAGSPQLRRDRSGEKSCFAHVGRRAPLILRPLGFAPGPHVS